MTTKLDVVNDCLAIMGEAPLNSLTDAHAFNAAAVNTLTRIDTEIQSKGWWYNTEHLTLKVNPVDMRIYLPNDTLTILPLYDRPHIVQRGRNLYDLKNGTNLFDVTQEYKVYVIRQVPFDELPLVISNYIARLTVLSFQNEYDGDGTKTRNLMLEIYGNPQLGTMGLKGEAMAEHIRNRQVNFINESPRLARIRRVVGYSTRFSF